MPTSHIAQFEECTITLNVQSSISTPVTIMLKDNGTESDVVTVDLNNTGMQTVPFKHTFESKGLHELTFEITQIANDLLEQNNSYSTYFSLEVFNKILVIESAQNTSEAFENYRAAREQAKEERERKRAAFHVYADKEKRKRAKEGKLKDKVFCFSHALELQTELAQSLLQSAFAQAARITFRAEECDLYVCFETESGPRLQSVQARGARVLTPEAFGKLCED